MLHSNNPNQGTPDSDAETFLDEQEWPLSQPQGVVAAPQVDPADAQGTVSEPRYQQRQPPGASLLGEMGAAQKDLVEVKKSELQLRKEMFDLEREKAMVERENQIKMNENQVALDDRRIQVEERRLRDEETRWEFMRESACRAEKIELARSLLSVPEADHQAVEMARQYMQRIFETN